MRILFAAVVTGVVLLSGCEESVEEGTCIDQTSIDDNWQNDMLCKRKDGSTFETDYAGAEQFEAKRRR